MDTLISDVIDAIACYVDDLRSVFLWLATCQGLLSQRERVCTCLAMHTWGAEFWSTARKREVQLSKPYLSCYMELRRIEQFQLFLERQGLSRWTQRDFYVFWESTDKNFGLTDSRTS